MVDKSMEAISKVLSDMKFNKKMFGGVDELDVWKKIELLQNEYEKQIEILSQSYEAVIDHLKKEGKDNG